MCKTDPNSYLRSPRSCRKINEMTNKKREAGGVDDKFYIYMSDG